MNPKLTEGVTQADVSQILVMVIAAGSVANGEEIIVSSCQSLNEIN